MNKRSYGQFCGVSRALSMVGERWALLIVRDLLVGPRRYTDLRRGLPAIPTNILARRLAELEAHGVVRRRVLPRPDGSVVYELTDFGHELEDVILHLARWGSQALTVPEPGEVVTTDSLIMALRTTFRPERAGDATVRYELHFGDVVVHAVVDGAEVRAAAGPIDGADLVIEAGPEIRALMAGELDPQRAIADGLVRLVGPPGLLDRFVELFSIGPARPSLVA